MSYYGYEWKPYVSVAARRRKAEKVAAKEAKGGTVLSPVSASRGAIAKTFWGRAWCDNLERYSDYSNRLPRGRTYVRNGSVIDLQIGAGEVDARVVGSSLYQVTISVAAVPEPQWRAIAAECAASIDSLVELLQGRLSTAVMERICRPGTGLFPAPREIKLSCSCPDSAVMCKHVAAVLYGVGARLDQKPELLFQLRRVDAKDLVAQAGVAMPKSGPGPAAGKLLDEAQLGDVFGIEMDEAVAPRTALNEAVRRAQSAPPAAPARKVATPGKVAARSKIGAPAKLGAPTKSAAVAKVAAAAKGAATTKGRAAAKTAISSSKTPAAQRKATPGKTNPAAARSSAAKSSHSVKKPSPSRRG